VRAFGGGDRPVLEQRVARIEDLLGLADAGLMPGERVPQSADVAPAASAGDRAGPCAKAKIAGYRAWQEAVVRAKLNARAAEGACAGISNEKKKQACFFAAEGETRTIQAARDAIIAGGEPAREAIRAVKDDGRNDALASARAASDTAFAACADESAP
jgi:hypothetical protein